MKTEARNRVSKHEKVMRLHGLYAGSGDPLFVEEASSGGVETQLYLPKQEWRDLGQPAKITLTVRPGDHLNEDSPIIADFRGGVSL